MVRISQAAADDRAAAQNWVHAFNLLVAAEMQLNGGDRVKAVASVARKEPAIHEHYLRATNGDSAAY